MDVAFEEEMYQKVTYEEKTPFPKKMIGKGISEGRKVI